MSYCKVTRQWLPATEMKVAYDEYGDPQLVSKTVTTYYCEYCERSFLTNELTLAHRRGEEIKVCQECLDEDFAKCNDCGNYHQVNDLHYLERYDYEVCEDCFDEYYVNCDDCGTIIARDDSYQSYEGNYYCESCQTNYCSCEDCGQIIDNEDNCYYADDDEYSEYPYCRDCFLRRQPQVINSYGYKPTPKFNSLKNEKKTKEYFGMEIEVDGNAQYAEQFLEAFGDTEKDYIYLKRDGSVAGFEIVTHPMTRRFFYSKFVPKLREGMDFLKYKGFRGHNRAGIHIHVSNDAISQEQYKKLICLLYPENEAIYKKWLAITQRHDNAMRQWANMKLGGYDASKQMRKDHKKDYVRLADQRGKDGVNTKPVLSSGRYTAINAYNASTVEFRIFNSNIRPERIIKNAQVIFSLLDFTNTEALPTYHNYIRFVEDNRGEYRELWDFLVEKGIAQPREAREQYKKVMKALNTVSPNMTYEQAMNMLQEGNPNKLQGIDDNDERSAEPCVSQF